MKISVLPCVMIALVCTSLSALHAGAEAGPTYDPSVSEADGIRVVQVSDGPSHVVTVNERQAIQSLPDHRQIYFAVDNARTVNGRHPVVTIHATYLDDGEGHLILQYDSTDHDLPHDGKYKAAGQHAFTDTGEWKTHTFTITDAYLGDRQHLGADFRIHRTGDAPLTIARVAMDLVARSEPIKHVPASVLGATHASGKYFFDGKRDYLNEGAVDLAGMGLRVIKVWMHLDDPGGFYPWNSDWPKDFESWRAIAEHPHYRELWRRPFETYVLTITGGPSFRDGFPDPKPEKMERQFYDLASFFLTQYDGTGKTFILGTWESDWQLRGNMNTDPEGDPNQTAIEGMIRWYAARQRGVTRARADHSGSDVHVYAAAEVNHVDLAMKGRPTVTNRVLPKLNMDLVSISAWRNTLPIAHDERAGRRQFREALEYVDRMMPDTDVPSPFGWPLRHRNIFISEFGVPEVERGVTGSAQLERLTRGTVEVARQWGCLWIIYWQLYDNECCAPGDAPCEPVPGPNPGAAPASTREHCRGFWLRRVDGTTSLALQTLQEAMGPFVPPPEDFNVRASENGVVLEWTPVKGAHWMRLEVERDGVFQPLAILETDDHGKPHTYTHAVAKNASARYRVRSEACYILPSPWFTSR